MRLFVAFLAALAVFGVAYAAPAPAKRVVSIGGDVTEIVYALGAQAQLVGVDQTSVYPDAVHALPQVGYLRNLSAEGIISLKPDLVLAAKAAGPHAVLEQLGDAKIAIVNVTGEDSFAVVLAKIDIVAQTLGAQARATQVKAGLQ